MNESIKNIITANGGYVYIILFSLFVSVIIFRNNLVVYVTVVLGICLIFREEIRDTLLVKGTSKKQVNKQQTNAKKYINQTSLSKRVLQDLKKYKRELQK